MLPRPRVVAIFMVDHYIPYIINNNLYSMTRKSIAGTNKWYVVTNTPLIKLSMERIFFS